MQKALLLLETFWGHWDAVTAQIEEALRVSFIINKNVTTVPGWWPWTPPTHTHTTFRNSYYKAGAGPKASVQTHYGLCCCHKHTCTHIIQLHRIIIRIAPSALRLTSGSHLFGESSFRKREGWKQWVLKKEKALYSGVRVLALSDFKLLVEIPNRSSNGVKWHFLNILFRSFFFKSWHANESVSLAPALTASTAFNLSWALIQHQTNTSSLCSNWFQNS